MDFYRQHFKLGFKFTDIGDFNSFVYKKLNVNTYKIKLILFYSEVRILEAGIHDWMS